jgi:hypothetical protein
MTELIVGAAAAIVLAVLFILLLGNGDREESWEKKKKKKPEQNATALNGKTCPLCGASLHVGESVKSVLYPKSPGARDRLMEIHGCIHCYPPPGERKRICPVCRKEVPKDGDVIARMFETKETYSMKDKTHVHVLGCSGCYRRT